MKTQFVFGIIIQTDDHIIAPTDIITLDLSPQSNCIWGDYARTLILENGKIVKDIEEIHNDEWRNGLKMEEYLHATMRSFVDENTTFEELFYFINDQVKACGYVNLDFLGNLGHSIIKDKNQRIYIEKEIRKSYPLLKHLLLSRISACLVLYTDSKKRTYIASVVVC